MTLEKRKVYMAPELLEGITRSQESDVWSLGVAFLQIELGILFDEQVLQEYLPEWI